MDGQRTDDVLASAIITYLALIVGQLYADKPMLTNGNSMVRSDRTAHLFCMSLVATIDRKT